NAPGIVSDIVVSGIVPNQFIINPFVTVCLNIAHPQVGQLQIRLRSPDMSIIYLYFQSGFGANFTGTCFVPSGSPPITAGAPPFTGQWTPQDNVSPGFDLTGVNGTWSLMVDDVQAGSVGTLNDWSITFNTQNYLTYSWTPSVGLSTTTNDTT